MERESYGEVCVCVCVCVCAHTHARAHVLTPMHGCQELCSLSDSAVSSAWLFPCTESNSTRSREKQINLECLVARERKTGGKRRRWREWIWGSSNWKEKFPFIRCVLREETMSVTKKAEVWQKGGTAEEVESCLFKDKSVPPHP